MRKILIATPAKDGLGPEFMPGLIDVFRHKFTDADIDFCMMSGNAVNFARNDCIHYAREVKAREIVFIDADMGWTFDMLMRLLSHIDVDIVAGPYCKRKPGKPYWLLTPMPEAKTDPKTQLCEVLDVATGFMKIRVDTVIATMIEEMPEREYHYKPEEGHPITGFEIFPMGVVGPRTAEARLARIKESLAKHSNGHISANALEREVFSACYDDQPVGDLRGEDYYFCHLARKFGFKIFVDFGLPIIPHIGDVAFPITPDQVGIDLSSQQIAMRPA